MAYTILVPIHKPESGQRFDFKIDWGDGAVTYIDNMTAANYNTKKTDLYHIYSNNNEYDIKIYRHKESTHNHLERWNWKPSEFTASGLSPSYPIYANRIRNIKTWGDFTFGDTGHSFYKCSNMTITATDKPSFITGSSLEGAFYQCTALAVTGSTAETKFADWDTGPVTNFGSCFYQCTNFNESLSSWDVSGGTTFSSMFEGASSFNGNITWGSTSALNTSAGAGVNMSRMFADSGFNNNSLKHWNMDETSSTAFMFSGASNFNQDLSIWGNKMRNVTQMQSMFKNASSFNGEVGSWNTSKVNNMQEMFSGSNSFNKDISDWNVSKVTNMSSMFNGASSFNNGGGTGTTSNPLDWSNNDGGSNWSLSTTSNMFNGATNFNQTLSIDSDGVGDFVSMFAGASSFNNGGNDFSTSTFNTGSATNMNNMFKNATSFTGGGVGTFDTSGVTSMQSTFEGATNFNDDISNWETGSTTNMTNLLADATNFNQDISDWDVGQVTESEGILENTDLDPSNAESINDGWSSQPGVDPGLVEEVEEAEEAAAPTAPSYASQTGGDRADTVNVAENNTGILDLDASSSWAPDNMSALIAEGSMVKYVLEPHPNAPGDLDKFKLTSTTITDNPDLLFKTAPDFENPTDSSYGGTNTYYVRVKAYIDGAEGGYSSYSGFTPSGTAQLKAALDAWIANTANATAQYGHISTWNISQITSFQSLLFNKSTFNEDISMWDVSNVNNFNDSFYGTSSFNQNLGNWDMSSISNASNMLDNSGLSNANWDATLNGWNNTIPSTGTAYARIGALNLNRTSASNTAYNAITSRGWEIIT